jgi:hypothetical protein
MTMEDARLHNKDIYVMYANFKGVFNAADHRIMFKHMRQLDMPSTFVDTCEHLYGVSSTDYITPYGPTPSIDINRGTSQGDTLSPFLFTLFLEPFLRWLTVGSRGYRPGPMSLTLTPQNPLPRTQDTASPTTSASPRARPPTWPSLRKLSPLSAYTCMTVIIRKCCITGALWRSGNALYLANIALLASRL